MARIFHRTLLPDDPITPTNESSITNPCSNFCDPLCGNFDECSVFPGSGYPLPPLPPPLPPVSVVVSPEATTGNVQGVHLSPLVIVVVIVLASVFLVVSYYAVVVKYCTFWNRFFIIGRDRGEPPGPDTGPGGDRHATDAFIDHEDEDRDDPVVVDHPIWLISTIGLNQSVINAITMLRYKKSDGLIDGTDCSVCLSEFQEGETLRLLPKCNHAFHIDCIDTWLRSHTTCPLCRAGIVATSGRPSLTLNNDTSLGHSRRVVFSPRTDSDSNGAELGRSQRADSSGRVAEASRENNSNSHSNNVVEDNNAQNTIVIIRRSFSMDFFRGSNSRGGSHFQGNSSSRVLDSSSSSRPQPLRPAPMKRSYSWSERVFWTSRNQNNGNNLDISP